MKWGDIEAQDEDDDDYLASCDASVASVELQQSSSSKHDAADSGRARRQRKRREARQLKFEAMAEAAASARAQEDLLVKVLGELATEDQLQDVLKSMGVEMTDDQHQLLTRVVAEVKEQASMEKEGQVLLQKKA